MLKATLNNSDVRIEAALGVKSARLMEVLTAKMTVLMTRLQAKIVNEKLSGQVLSQRSGVAAGSVANPRAEVAGTSVVGILDWAGGPAWYLRLHNIGGDHEYAINPIYSASETRKLGRGTLQPHRVLHFLINGKDVFTRYVFHPPAKGRHFIEASVEEMRGQFVTGLKEALLGVMKS